MNNNLKVIIDNKNIKESVTDGINDAIFYATSLQKSEYDIRIVQSYNGAKSILKVYNAKLDQWVPLIINGIEINGFISKDIVNLIYNYKDLK